MLAGAGAAIQGSSGIADSSRHGLDVDSVI